MEVAEPKDPSWGKMQGRGLAKGKLVGGGGPGGCNGA